MDANPLLPKLPQYVAIADMPYRPGIAGAGALAFRREEQMRSNVHPSQIGIADSV
jgi:hypothetical protein